MNTFYHGDCLFVMNHDIEPESIDLIYLDPPFFTGKVQTATAKWKPGEMEVSYEDSKKFWKTKGYSTNAPDWLKHIAINRPDFASYLYYIMVRLQACHKILKRTGSIYLHCDEKASHYLKMIMDEIFGYKNYRNEIIWDYKRWTCSSNNKFNKMHDTILFYSRGGNLINHQYEILKNPKKQNKNDGNGKSLRDEQGKVVYHIQTQRDVSDVWSMPFLNPVSKERVGYPTQKPLDLLERIIKASSNEGDTILDPFCGCGTAIIAAQRLNRNWIGIDISKDAYEISSKRHGELPLVFTHFNYVSRELSEIKALSPGDFEKWVNEFYKATKPFPDKGVDGVTKEGAAIQSKSFTVKYNVLSQLVTDAKHHHATSKPVKEIILASQIGFDDSTRKLKFEIETTDNIKVRLETPETMLEGIDSL